MRNRLPKLLYGALLMCGIMCIIMAFTGETRAQRQRQQQEQAAPCSTPRCTDEKFNDFVPRNDRAMAGLRRDIDKNRDALIETDKKVQHSEDILVEIIDFKHEFVWWIKWFGLALLTWFGKMLVQWVKPNSQHLREPKRRKSDSHNGDTDFSADSEV